MSEYKKGKLLKKRSAGQTKKTTNKQPLDKKNITMSFVVGIETRNKMCEIAESLRTQEIEQDGEIYDFMKPSDTQLIIGLSGKKAIDSYNRLQEACIDIKERVDGSSVEELTRQFMSNPKQVFELLNTATVVSYGVEESEVVEDEDEDEDESDEDEE